MVVVSSRLAPQSQGASAMTDKAINFASAQAFTLYMSSANALDSFSLLAYSLTLYP